MKRREFIGLIGGAAVLPLTARAQQRTLPVIGFFGAGSPGPFADRIAAFRDGLKRAGFVEGRNVAIEFRWAETGYDQLPSLAAELVDRRVDVLVTGNGAVAAKSATTTIPLVCLFAGDPVNSGLVASLNKPGSNLTGVSLFAFSLGAKRFELLHELVPNKLIAVLANPSQPKAVDVKNVGRELGVRYVLEGSVRKASGKVRITGQLIEPATNNHLWAEKFDGDLQDIFELQDKITMSVVGSIAPMLEQAEIARATQKPTERLDCYDFYLRGLSSMRRRSWREAREIFKKAIEKDENFGPAHAMIAWSMLNEQANSGAPLASKMRAEAIRFARKAARLAPDDAFSLSRSGHVLTYIGHEYDLGASLVEEALARNPNLSVAWYSQGWVALMCGDAERSVQSFDTLLRLSPLDPLRPSVWNGKAFALFILGRYQEGCIWAAKAHQVYTDVHTFSALALNYVGIGRIEEAKEAVSQLLKMQSDFSVNRAMQAFPARPTDFRNRIAAALEQAGLPV